MDTITVIFFASLLFLLFVLMFQKTNRSRVKLILNSNKNVEQLYLKKSAELKRQKLKAALRHVNTSGNNYTHKKRIEQEFELLYADFKKGVINVTAYHQHLEMLLDRTEALIKQSSVY